MLLIVTLANFVVAFNSFPIIFVMTQGGPINRTDILATYLYQQGFQLLNFGLASAFAVVVLRDPAGLEPLVRPPADPPHEGRLMAVASRPRSVAAPATRADAPTRVHDPNARPRWMSVALWIGIVLLHDPLARCPT